MMSAASAACGNCNACLIESREQLAHFPFLTSESDAQMTGKALGRMAKQVGIRESPQDFGRDVFTQSGQAGGFLVQFLSGDFCCSTETDNARDVFRRRAQAALLAASEDYR